MSKSYRQAVKRTDKYRGEKRMFTVTLALVIMGVAVLLMGFNLFSVSAQPAATPVSPVVTPGAPDIAIAAPAPQLPLAPTVAAVQPPQALPLDAHYSGVVGLVAGHKGNDSGAVCPDGLTEAEVNANVTQEVASLLERRGLRVDILNEFDDRLSGYQADALVSIHADSCSVPGLTGFKAARVTNSAIPQAEDLLVQCLNKEYAAYTGLPQHPSSITDSMTNYHAFREIASGTPGAIIETGFLLGDRYLLESKPKIVARGVAAGILCFFDQRATVAAP